MQHGGFLCIAQMLLQQTWNNSYCTRQVLQRFTTHLRHPLNIITNSLSDSDDKDADNCDTADDGSDWTSILDNVFIILLHEGKYSLCYYCWMEHSRDIFVWREGIYLAVICKSGMPPFQQDGTSLKFPRCQPMHLTELLACHTEFTKLYKIQCNYYFR